MGQSPVTVPFLPLPREAQWASESGRGERSGGQGAERWRLEGVMEECGQAKQAMAAAPAAGPGWASGWTPPTPEHGGCCQEVPVVSGGLQHRGVRAREAAV